MSGEAVSQYEDALGDASLAPKIIEDSSESQDFSDMFVSANADRSKWGILEDADLGVELFET